MKFSQWKTRIIYRDDMSSRVTHLTKGQTNEEAFDKLMKILSEKKIEGGTGFVNKKIPVVCLQDVPLSAIAENLFCEKTINEGHNNKNRYLAFGLRFTKLFIYKHGGRPVIYGDSDELKSAINENEWWRIVDMDLSNKKNITDWSHEREWRVKGNLSFKYNQVEIIVPSPKYYKKFVEYCLEKDKIEMLKEIRGVITLNSIYA